jgi:predicted enzyme related to lactoylglutathione lyase
MRLFGWDAIDNDMGEGAIYSLMQVRGKPVAAIATNSPDAAGAAAVWAVYVTVTSADVAAERAKELGALVGGEGPFDVENFGRMAFITDPQGVEFRLWEPRAHIGAEVVREPGAVAWFELASPDPTGSAKFYSDLLDWTVAGAEGMEDYLFARTADGEGTGAIEPASDGQAVGWIVYFWTDDVDATLAVAKEHGADELVPATDIPGDMGRFAIVRDPQGAAFGLYKA